MPFPVLEEPPPIEASAGAAGANAASAGERSLLGYGLLTPFRRDRKADFTAGGGYELVRSAIAQVLAVRADDGRMTGELPWRPEFGSLLHRLQYANLDEAYGDLVRSRVVSAIDRWEPRARVMKVQVLRGLDAQGQVSAFVRVEFQIVQAGSGNVLAGTEKLDVPLPT